MESKESTKENKEKERASPPLKKFRAGAVCATVWNNPTKDGEGAYKSISLERGYKDKEGAWHNTGSLRTADLPKATLVLQKAYEYLAMGEDAEA